MVKKDIVKCPDCGAEYDWFEDLHANDFQEATVVCSVCGEHWDIEYKDKRSKFKKRIIKEDISRVH